MLSCDVIKARQQLIQHGVVVSDRSVLGVGSGSRSRGQPPAEPQRPRGGGGASRCPPQSPGTSGTESPGLRADGERVSPGASVAAMKYGFPSLANIKTRESYVTSYDPRTRTASWVIERLNPASLSGSSNRKYCDFREDDSVHLFHRSTNDDYRGSGFDRGHLAAAANHKWSQKAMDDTFYLSNVAPQVKHTQAHTHTHTRTHTHSYSLCVCSEPSPEPEHLEQSGESLSLFDHTLPERVRVQRSTLPAQLCVCFRQEADGKLYVRYQVIGKNHVAVPTHFFKVLILEQADGRGVELRSYVLPNEPIDEKVPLDRFLVPIETIERASGLLFVPNIMKRTSSLQAVTDRPTTVPRIHQ
ncbi:endonuclease G, mitochondrial isoform X1 [Hippoglossus hippoglossus]|uniref:endonuclease G, mitochondrial isoform X1 n=1 Tax=Hippoglossus hippoglossus TaxID=8267 RepID=UPI00148C3D59|nr:endonuclease G, mitochondrial isoform X1 [Hippoglossus hippoglossus]